MGPAATSLAIGLLVSQAAPASMPLEPTGTWLISRAPDKCTLLREFSSGEETVRLVVSPAALGDQAEIAIVAPGSGKPAYTNLSGKMAIDARDIAVSFATWLTPKALRVTRMNLPQADLDTIATATTIRLPVAPGKNATFAVRDMASAFRDGAACNVDLRASWGMNEAEFAAMATPAQGISKGDWIVQGDYPADALRAKVAGSVAILWMIGTDGMVTQCRTLKSSGNTSLDNAACSAITRRGRYVPAKDAAGRPIRSWGSRTVVWMLP